MATRKQCETFLTKAIRRGANGKRRFRKPMLPMKLLGSNVIPGDRRMVMGKVKLLSSVAEDSVKESVQ